MLDFKEKTNEAFETIKNIANAPRIGMILDFDFRDLTYDIEDVDIISCHEISDFPDFFSEKYENIIIGNLQGKKVICTQANNSHLEKCSIEDITFYIKLLQYIGTKSLIMATTVKNKNFSLGDLIIKSYINSSQEMIEMVTAIAQMFNMNVIQYSYKDLEFSIINHSLINVLELSCITDNKSDSTNTLYNSKKDFVTLFKEIIALL